MKIDSINKVNMTVTDRQTEIVTPRGPVGAKKSMRNIHSYAQISLDDLGGDGEWRDQETEAEVCEGGHWREPAGLGGGHQDWPPQVRQVRKEELHIQPNTDQVNNPGKKPKGKLNFKGDFEGSF